MSANTNKSAPEAGRQDREYKVELVDENLAVRLESFDNRKVTGAQIAAKAGFLNPDNVVVLQQLDTLIIEEVRADEQVDLKGGGKERFFVINGDRTYRFVLDDAAMAWPRALVSGAALLFLARKDAQFEVLQIIPEHPSQVIDVEELVSLEGRGTEHFKTRRADRTIIVFYGDDEVTVERGVYSTEQLLALFQVEAGYLLNLVKPDGTFVELQAGARLRLKAGMRFISQPPSGSSS